MRLSEKTLEINICSEITATWSNGVFWFGLTQQQEAVAGFDVCTKLGGHLLILQFKASSHDVHGFRRFQLGHNQMMALRSLVGSCKRSVFYVFPLTGKTSELSGNVGQLLKTTWLLDVASLPSLTAPKKQSGGLRKTLVHYADVMPGSVRLHSDPVDLELVNLHEFLAAPTLRSGESATLPPKMILDDTRYANYLWAKGMVGGVLLGGR